MNTQSPETVAEPPALVSPDNQHSPEAPAQPPPDTSPSGVSDPDNQPLHRAARSKIAHLPKVVRDKINFMLRDGVEHAELLTKLGDDAKDISRRNVSDWSRSPSYQHWLLEQQWREDLRADQESASDLVDDFDSAKFNQGALQLAATRLFLAFRHLESHDLNQKLGGNAQSFARLVHALARASRESTNIQKYRDACAQAVAAELKQLNIERDLSDNEYALIMKRMDKVFKVGRPPKPADGSPPNGSAPGTLSNAPGTPK